MASPAEVRSSEERQAGLLEERRPQAVLWVVRKAARLRAAGLLVGRLLLLLLEVPKTVAGLEAEV